MINVLYVDDEAGLLEITKLFLEKDGDFTVDTAISAQEALAAPSVASYDAIVSDYQMPTMDGIAFLKVIRGQFGDIPFILFTGRGREEVVIDAINNGADFYIQKGGDPKAQFAELAHKIRQAVRRKQAERSLFDSERRLADIIDFLPDATFAIDRSGKVIAWNRAIEEMTGVPAIEMLGKGNFEYAIPLYGSRHPIIIDLIDGTDEDIRRYYTNVYRDGTSIMAETDLTHPKGHRIPVLARVCHLYNQAGTITGTIESIRDISERKRTEEVLQTSERRLATIYNTVSDVIFNVSVEPGGRYRFSSVNPAFCRVTGIPEATVVGKLVDEIIPEPSLTMVLEKYRQAIAEKSIVRWEETSDYPTGRLIGEVGVTPVYDSAGTCTHLVGSVHDITRRKQVEQSLQESEQALMKSRQQLEDAMDLAGLVNWEFDFTTGMFIFDDRFFSLAGTSAEREGGSRISVDTYAREFLHPDDMHAVAEEMENAAKSTNPDYLSRREHRIVCRDGRIRHVLALIRVMRDVHGRPVRVHGTIQDRTGQNLTQDALRESGGKFRPFVGNTEDTGSSRD